MNTVALNNLWNYLSNLSLSARNKEWLSDKLIESAHRDKTESKANEALRMLDGCWANDSDAEEMTEAISNARKGKARTVEPMDEA